MSAATLKDAARAPCDEIEHATSLASIVGGLIGFAVGVAVVLVLVSNPVGWVAMAGVASLALSAGTAGMWLGEKIGALFAGPPKDILTGSLDVTVGARNLQAARVMDPVKCHSGKRIASGCATISINRLPAARVDEETECAGKIKTGCTTVKYGGPSVKVLAVEAPWYERWYNTFKVVVDWASFITGIVSIKGAITGLRGAYGALRGGLSLGKVLAAADATYEVVDHGLNITKRFAEGKIGDLYEAVGLGPRPTWMEPWAITQTDGYRTFDMAWSTVGLGRDARDIYKATRPASPAPTIQTPEAPQGMSRTDGGILVRDPPAGHSTTDGGIIVQQQTTFQGQTFNRSESGLFLPGSASGPSDAPRISPPASGSPAGDAPRISPTILDASGAPMVDAPRLQAPPALVDASGAPIASPPPPMAGSEAAMRAAVKGGKYAIEMGKTASEMGTGPSPGGP